MSNNFKSSKLKSRVLITLISKARIDSLYIILKITFDCSHGYKFSDAWNVNMCKTTMYIVYVMTN